MILAGAVFLGIKFVPPYWTYFSMQDIVGDAAMSAAQPGRETRAGADLMQAAQALGLMITEDDIDISKDESGVVVRVEWDALVDLLGYDYTLHFRIEKRASTP